jgi:hypothetical protein
MRHTNMEINICQNHVTLIDCAIERYQQALLETCSLSDWTRPQEKKKEKKNQEHRGIFENIEPSNGC